MTRDIDIVIEADDASLDTLVAEFDPGRFYIDDVHEALAHGSIFNIIDTLTGWRIDAVIRKERLFSIEEFSRRRRARIGGVNTFVASAEDTILSKLEWARMSGSRRQIHDVVAMLVIQGGALDGSYLDRWAEELGVTGELQDARASAAAIA